MRRLPNRHCIMGIPKTPLEKCNKVLNEKYHIYQRDNKEPMVSIMEKEAYSIMLEKALHEIIQKPEFKISLNTIRKYFKEFQEITNNAVSICNDIYTKYTGNELS